MNHIAYNALVHATIWHKDQKRRYSNDPYIGHLVEVAGYLAAIGVPQTSLAIAYLHDSIEDAGITYEQLLETFGQEVADGVMWLTDVEEGNRRERKAAACQRLAKAPGHIQTIKYADIISNARSINTHDANFAKVFKGECRDALVSMGNGNATLWHMAWDLCRETMA